MRTKKIVLLLSLLIVAILFSLSASAYSLAYVIDDAALLTADEVAEVEAYYDRIYTEDDLLLVFATAYGKGNIVAALPDYADGAKDMLLLYVDMETRDFDIYQYNAVFGEAAFQMTSIEINSVLDAVYAYAAEGAWYGAALCFADEGLAAFQNSTAFVGGVDHYGDEGYQSYDQPVSFCDVILGALPVALIISSVITLIVWLSYKKKVRGDTYPLNAFAKMKLTASQDNFLTKTLSVTVIRHEDGGHAGSNHSSGGRSGGGHMGGRSF